MSFIFVNATPSAALATNGTQTFVFGSAADMQKARLMGGHVIYAEGIQSLLQFPKDFSVSWSVATATVTYLGTTTIPAGTLMRGQFETGGENQYLTDYVPSVLKNNVGSIRAINARWMNVKIGAPILGTATGVLAATAYTTLNLVTLATPVVLDVPRAVSVKSSSASDTTPTVITIRGFDEYGAAMSEALTLNGTTKVSGNKAFATVTSYQATTGPAMVGNLSIGNDVKAYGLPFFLPGGTGGSNSLGWIIELKDGVVPTAGTVKGGDLTLATGTTGDVRGTYAPNAASDGVIEVDLLMVAPDNKLFLGVPQYSA